MADRTLADELAWFDASFTDIEVPADSHLGRVRAIIHGLCRELGIDLPVLPPALDPDAIAPDLTRSGPEQDVQQRAHDLCEGVMDLVMSRHSGDKIDGRVTLLGLGIASGCYANAMTNPTMRMFLGRRFIEAFIATSDLPFTLDTKS